MRREGEDVFIILPADSGPTKKRKLEGRIFLRKLVKTCSEKVCDL